MTKKELRQKLLGYRNSLPESSFKSINRLIVQRLMKLPEIRSSTCIHCYWPIAGKRELDTTLLIRQLVSENKRVILPVVENFDGEAGAGNRMTHRMYEGETKLVPNRWGIKEPASIKPFPINRLDVVIVPALGVDRHGHRLGYGKGFYDEFLARCECPFICPVYSKCLLDDIPTMPHDIAVDIIVTEYEVIRVQQTDVT